MCTGKFLTFDVKPVANKHFKRLVCFNLEDRRLRLLGSAVRGALLHNFTNGISKSVIQTLIGVVIEHGLCAAHQGCLHV